MANKYANNETSPANTDDALEGPLRIREIKQAYNERLGRDHLMGGITSPDVIAQGADSADSGYHRRLTIIESATDQASSSDTRLNASSTGINHGTTAKMAEVWVEKSSATSNETSIRFLGTEGTGNERTVVSEDQTQTLTNKTLTAATLTNPTISGGAGSLDGVAIGQTTEAAGKFTTLESTGDTVVGAADTDTLTLKAATNGLSSDEGGTTGANKFYAGLVGEIRMFAGASLPAGWLWCNGAQYTKASKAELYAAIGDAYNATGNSVNSGLYGNYISSAGESGWFRVPDLRGRTTVGTGQGYDTSDSSITGVDVDGDESTDATTRLTTRTLGQYGGGEEHTLTAAQSGAGPHYHAVPLEDLGHAHNLGRGGTYSSSGSDGTGEAYGYNSTEYQYNYAGAERATAVNSTVGVQAKANAAINTTSEPAVDSDAFRDGKSNLNPGVEAASGHTQMQPWLAINYIIKY